MKKFITLLLFILMVVPVSATQLWEYGDFNERAELATLFGIVQNKDDYTGDYEQNVALLNLIASEIKDGDGMVGGASGSAELPQVIAGFETSLTSKITSSDTSLTLVSGTTDFGNTLSGWYGLTLDIGSSNQEYVVGNCAGTTCSSLVRGVSTDDGISTSSTYAYTHRRGAAVQITDHPNLVIMTNIFNGVDGVPDILYYDSSNTFTTSKQLVDKNYADNLVNQGAATSTETLAGISELSTASEQASATYLGANRPLVLQARYASSTPASNYVVVSESDNYLNQGWIDLSEAFTFTNATTTTQLLTTTILRLGSTNVTATADELNKLDGATTTVTATNLNTLTAGVDSDSDALHTHGTFDYLNGVGSNTNKSYINFSIPWVISADVPTTNFWTTGNATLNSNLSSVYIQATSDVVNNVITTGGLMMINGTGGVRQFDDGKDVIVEFSLAMRQADTEQQGFGLAASTIPFGEYDDIDVDACCYTVDTSGNLYAHTADAGAGDTNVAITGTTLTNLNTYRIEFEAGVSCKYFVNGELEVTSTTTMPNGANNILFGMGSSGNSGNTDRMTMTIPNFSMEK